MNEQQKIECKALFEKLHCGSNKWALRKNSTTGEYVLPSIEDAYNGFETCYKELVLKLVEKENE